MNVQVTSSKLSATSADINGSRSIEHTSTRLTRPTVRFLDLVKPFTPLIPEIAVPETKTPFQQRLIWTGVTLLIFLVMSQMPLYGIVSSG